MPFERPDLANLILRTAADVESRLEGTDAILRRHLCTVLARMDAGLAHELHGHLAWLARQLMPDTAEEEYMERWANIWRIYRKGATSASGPVPLREGQPGALVPAGTIMQRGDGVQYAVLASVECAQDGTATAQCQAVLPGISGNAGPGCRLSLVAPLIGIQASLIAPEGFSGGAEEENDASLRSRLLERIQRPPRGGSVKDYVDWTLEVPGFTRAWVEPCGMGLGTVIVWPLMDGVYQDGIPQEADLQRLREHLDAVRPATADVYVCALVPKLLNPHIHISPDTPAVRAAVTEKLQAIIRRDAVPAGVLLHSRLREAISTAAGEEDHALLYPLDNVQHAKGHIAALGEITWGEA